VKKSKQSAGYGHHGSASQPGTSTPRKLRQWGESGNGELGAFQREVNRMFRQSTDSYVRPDAHVIDVEDVFKGLNLDSEAEGKLSAVLTQTRSEYGPHPQLRVPRIVHARIRLMDTLRAMKQIDSTTRMEIQRRAMAYWKRNHPDYDQAPTIRYVAMGKSMKKSGDGYTGKGRRSGGPGHYKYTYGPEHRTEGPYPGAPSFESRTSPSPGTTVYKYDDGPRKLTRKLAVEVRDIDMHLEHLRTKSFGGYAERDAQQAKMRALYARKAAIQKRVGARDVSEFEAMVSRAIRSKLGKSMRKAEKRRVPDEDDAAVASYFPGEEEDDGDGYDDYDEGDGDGYDEEGGEEGEEGYGDEAGGATSHPSDRRAQPEGDEFNSLSPEEQMQVIDEALAQGEISEEEAEEARAEIGGGEEVDQNIVSAVEAMEEVEIEGGRILHFGQGIEAHLPDDADFHHHATEYAKHRAGYQINKDKDPEMADAHKHAANIHASIGNAMHSAGDLERRRLPGSDGSGTAESHEAALAQTEAGAMAGGPNPDMGEPEDLPMPGGPLGTNGPGGAPAAGGPPPKPGGGGMQVPSPRDDIAGGPQPGMPDMQRNAPGRDSEFETAQKMSGKLRSLMGKMSHTKPPLKPQQMRGRLAGGQGTRAPKQVMGGGQGKRLQRPQPFQESRAEIYRHQSSEGDELTEKHSFHPSRVTQHVQRADAIIGRARLVGKLNGVAAKMMGGTEEEESSVGFVGKRSAGPKRVSYERSFPLTGKQRQQIRGVQLTPGPTPTHYTAAQKRVHGGGITGKMAHYVMVGKDKPIGTSAPGITRHSSYQERQRAHHAQSNARVRAGGRRIPRDTSILDRPESAGDMLDPAHQAARTVARADRAGEARAAALVPNRATAGNAKPKGRTVTAPGRTVQVPSRAERTAAQPVRIAPVNIATPAPRRAQRRRAPGAGTERTAAQAAPPSGGTATGSSSPRGGSTRQSILNDMAALRHGRATRELFRSDVLLIVPAGKRLKKSK